MKQLIKNGTVVSSQGSQKMDVLMENGRITRVERNIQAEDAQVHDASGKLLFPGFIDGHTHLDLEVANTVTADDFEKGTKAAVAGGTTMVIDFATQNKGESLKEALANWHRKAEGKCSCDYGFHMAISQWNDQVKQEIQDMIDEGITSFKLYMTYPAMLLNDGDLYRVIKELNQYDCFAGVHCENADLIDALIQEAKSQGRLGPDTHPKVRPPAMEGEAVHRLMTIADQAKAPVMVVHLTCREALEEIRAAREKGQTVYAETCPQYLLLDDSLYEQPGFEGAKYVCSPPLRMKEDQEVLWKALAEGEIQTIATDQCSFTMAQKEMGKDDFTKIPNGMPGLQTRVPLLYTYGVEAGRITREQMCSLLSENPAKLYGIYPQKGVIQPGSDGDIVIIDPNENSVIKASELLHNTDYSPFEGFPLKGIVDQVFLRGDLVAQRGRLLKEKTGTYVRRSKISKE